MDLSKFYNPCIYDESQELTEHWKLKGWLKQKKDANFVQKFGLNERSKKVYCQIFLEGRLFICFSSPPNLNSFDIKYYFFASQIKDVVDNYENKESHFLVKLENENYHYKCDDLKQKQKWFQAFLYFKKLYKKKPQDTELQNIEQFMPSIQKEVEILNWSEISQEFDFGCFVFEKNLSSFFQKNNYSVLKNRILITRCEFKKRASRNRNSLISSLIQVSNYEKLKIKRKFVYLVLISRIPLQNFNKLANDNEEDDIYLLSSDDLPEGYQFFQIYLFTFDNFFDKSKAFDCFEIQKNTQMEVFNQKKKINIENADFQYSFYFKYFWEFLSWEQSVQKIKDFKLKVQEKKILELKYNFSKIVKDKFQTVTKSIDVVLLKIFAILKNCKIGEFEQKFNQIIVEWNHFQDSLNSLKQIPSNHVSYSGIYFLKNLQPIIKNLWRTNYAQLGALDILLFAKLGYQVNQSLFQWNYLVNPTMNFDDFAFKVFLNKIFLNSTKIITQILTQFQENIYYENNLILSQSSDQLENLILFILDHFEKIPTFQSAMHLIELSAILIFYFFLNLRLIIGQHQVREEVFLSLLNNNYQKTLSNIYKYIFVKIKKSISLLEIKNLFNNNFILEIINQIEQISLQETCNHFRKKLRQVYMKQNDFLKFDFIKDYQSTLIQFQDLFKQIDKKYHLKKINNSLVQEMILIYLKKLMDFNKQINKENYNKILQKIKKEQIQLENVMKDISDEKKQKFQFFFSKIVSFLENDDVDELVVEILNIYTFYENLGDPQNLKNLLKLKIYHNKASIDYILDYINPIILENLRMTLQFKQDEENKIKNIFVYFFFFRQSILKRVKKEFFSKQKLNAKKFRPSVFQRNQKSER